MDDRAHKADASFFPGTFIHFGSPRYPDWEAVMKRFRMIEADKEADPAVDDQPDAQEDRARVRATEPQEDHAPPPPTSG